MPSTNSWQKRLSGNVTLLARSWLSPSYLLFGKLILALEVTLLLLRLADALLLVAQCIDLLHHRVDLNEPSKALMLRLRVS